MKVTEIRNGETYFNGKNGIRRIYRIQNDSVFYEMISGGANRFTENLGVSKDGHLKFKCSLRSFAAWAKEEVELVERASKGSLDIELMQRRLAAFEAFQQGASIDDASRSHGIGAPELEGMIRLQFESNVSDLAGAIAVELGRTQPAEIQEIEAWLRRSMIWIIHPEADLVAEARANVDFSSCATDGGPAS